MFRYFFVLVCFLALAACGRQPDQKPLPPTITFPTPTVTAITPASMDPRTAPTDEVPDASARPIPPQPTPADLVGGDVVQDGPFTFFLWLFRDPRMNQQPAIPSLYSDLDGIGIYKSWVYQGPDLSGPARLDWGTLPQLNPFMEYSSLTNGEGDGGLGGVLLPGGPFLPGESKPGDQIQIAMRMITREREYGAVLTFTLQLGANGFEPMDIRVDVLH